MSTVTEVGSRFPILFLSLDADPVTPLSSAIKMSRGFGNESATLLIQQGYVFYVGVQRYVLIQFAFSAMVIARKSPPTLLIIV